MEEHPTIVVMHRGEGGCTHCHAVFNRVHPENLNAVDVWRNYERHDRLARQMERDWGGRQLASKKRERYRDYSNGGRGEVEQGQRSGLTVEQVHDIRADIRQARQQSDSAQAFAQALHEAGLKLQRGERRDFITVDEFGNPYGIGRRTTGATAQQVRERMGRIDLDNWRPQRQDQKRGDDRGRTQPFRLSRCSIPDSS